MTALFLYGRLLEAETRWIVFGQEVPLRPAIHPKARVAWHNGPVLVPGSGSVDGLMADLGEVPGALARADVLSAATGLRRAPVTIEVAGRSVTVETYLSSEVVPDDSPTFDQALWSAKRAPLDRAIAQDMLALWPERSADELRRRRTQIAVRAQARVNAEAEPAPMTLRRRAAPGDVAVLARRQPYANFFSVEEYDLTHATFGGGRSEVLNRAAFLSGDAVVVLPYDPVRDRVLLTEQFRTGPMARGDRQPWSLEAIAGRIDPAETPETTAHREAEEEAGLTLGQLIALGGCYPSPGAKAEYLYNFIALADLPDAQPQTGGLASEGEDIRSHVIGFEHMMDLIDSGEINNGPLMLIALQLAQRRPGLRDAALGESVSRDT